MPSSSTVASAVQERERRSTAGKRLTFLAGQELENDEAFWGHETWQEDSESFHSSDAENDENAVDEFDSDFDESESDHEEEEEALGAAEERQIALDERDSKKRQSATTSAYTDKKAKGGKGSTTATTVGATGAEKRGRWSKGKRIMGNGLNAGIVLNIPPAYQQQHQLAPPQAPATLPATSINIPGTTVPLQASDTSSMLQQSVATTSSTIVVDPTPVPPHALPLVPPPPPSQASSIAPVAATTVASSISAAAFKRKANSHIGLAASRARRTNTEVVANVTDRQPESATSGGAAAKSSLDLKSATTLADAVPAAAAAAAGVAAAGATTKRVKRSFTQAEMLLEAVKQTEPENDRWLLGRKRRQAEKDETESSLRDQKGAAGGNSEVIEKFVSRRGYLNTILFPSMDHVPAILSAAASSAADDPMTAAGAGSSITDDSTIASPTTTNSQTHQCKTACVITGKVARYKDPLTGQGYYDVQAFRELRRRHAEKLAKTKSSKAVASAESAKDKSNSTNDKKSASSSRSSQPYDAKPAASLRAAPPNHTAQGHDKVSTNGQSTVAVAARSVNGNGTSAKTPSPKKGRGRPNSAEKKSPGAASKKAATAPIAASECAPDELAKLENDTTLSSTVTVPTTALTSVASNVTQSFPLSVPETSHCTNVSLLEDRVAAPAPPPSLPLPTNTTASPLSPVSSTVAGASAATTSPTSPSPTSPGRRSGRKRTLTARMMETLSTGLFSPKGQSAVATVAATPTAPAPATTTMPMVPSASSTANEDK